MAPSAEPGRTTPWVIWGAFMAAPLTYCLIAWLIVRGLTEPRSAPLELTAALAVCALGTVAAGYLLPGLALRRGWTRRSVVGPALGASITAMIIRWACFEAVAIYGFVLSIVAGSLTPALVGAVVALPLLATSRPDPDAVGRDG